MYTDYEVRQIPLTLKSGRAGVEKLLAQSGLRLERVDYYAGVFPADGDELLAGAGLYGDVIKCVAVSPEARDGAMTNRLVSHLISVAMAGGHTSVKLFTKPGNEAVFRSLGFRLLATAPEAVFMETGAVGLDAYCRYLRGLRQEGRNGAVVMNANPFTRGHRYLIELAAAEVDTLYIIAVKEDLSRFTYAERLEMIRAGCCGIPNVIVCEGSDYAVSALTFPTYFIKSLDSVADTHITLDLSLFAGHIAPALGVSVRFVGSEPDDELTARYNALMKSQLPASGIMVEEIERLPDEGVAVSASVVRHCLDCGSLHRASRIVPRTTVPFLIGDLATVALRQELDAAPKPGLVDPFDNGAHDDMDHALMSASIDSLRGCFMELAQNGFNTRLRIDELIEIGKIGEESMLQATHGVNTHKGALFSLGLAVAAAARQWQLKGSVTTPALRDSIAELAGLFPEPEGTHGAEVRQRYGIEGALEHARRGYPGMFDRWLPFYSRNRGDKNALLKTLLLIMSDLADTNIYFRKGPEAADDVRRRAALLFNDFSIQALESMNADFKRDRISPGGAADMLALTLFVHSVTN